MEKRKETFDAWAFQLADCGGNKLLVSPKTQLPAVSVNWRVIDRFAKDLCGKRVKIRVSIETIDR